MDGNSKQPIAFAAQPARHNWKLAILAAILSSGSPASNLAAQQPAAQDSSAQAPEQRSPKRLTGPALREHIADQLQLLESPSYRERELARYRIQQYPYAAIVAIVEAAPKVSIDTAAQYVNLLDTFSTNPDVAISSAAYDVLKQLSLKEGTALAGLANNSTRAIENVNELKAYEILTHLGANIGYLNLSVNGAQTEGFSSNFISLEIRSELYGGDDRSLTWIRYLRSVEVVALSGPIVTAELLSFVAQMPNVKKVLIEDAALQPEELLPLKSIAELQHLELNYMPAGDEFVPVLCQLPLTQSLRLYGTSITGRGEEVLAKKLEGLEIYRSNGGFLGIASPAVGEVVVTRVVPGSAAANAGIRLNDRITEIEDKPIKNFSALRSTLANYSPEEPVQVKVIRQVIDPKTMRRVPTEMVVTVVLGKQEKN